MAPKYPKRIVVRDGREFKVGKVWYPMGRGVFRVSWEDGDKQKGCLAIVDGDDFVFLECEHRGRHEAGHVSVWVSVVAGRPLDNQTSEWHYTDDPLTEEPSR